jgi:hypothetical protein
MLSACGQLPDYEQRELAWGLGSLQRSWGFARVAEPHAPDEVFRLLCGVVGLSFGLGWTELDYVGLNALRSHTIPINVVELCLQCARSCSAYGWALRRRFACRI